jgi:type II secretory pathway pseudopilin PulG
MKRWTPHRRRRRGVTLLELVAAAAVLAAATGMTAQVVVWTRAASRAADAERLAWQEASNCLELLTAEGYEALTPQRVAECRLNDATAAALGAGQLTVTLTALDERGSPKRILAEVSWEDRAAGRKRAVRLTTIVYTAAVEKTKEGTGR